MKAELDEPRLEAAANDEIGGNWFLSGSALVALIATIKVLIHSINRGGYGLFVDELYFLAAGEHLDWGYVDMPPLAALMARFARTVFGESVFGIHLLPALFGGALVLLTGRLVRELGGGRRAQLLAAIAVLVAPFNLVFGSYLSMNSIEPLIWMGCGLVVIRIIKTGNTKLWVWFGVLAGIGLLNKHTMLMFGFAMIVGILVTPERRLLFDRWLVIGGLIALVIFLPNLVWNIRHDFPMLELLANIRASGRNVRMSPLGFIGQQILGVHPLTLPISLAGLFSLLVLKHLRRFRSLGTAFLVTLAILFLTDGRFYYLAPIYSMLFAAGAVEFERRLARPRLRLVLPAYGGVLMVTGALLAPIVLPILPPETFVRYGNATGLAQPQIETRRTSALPQLFADRFGWPEMVEAVARVYHSLPPDEKAKAAIFGQDYGQAGAIDFYGPKLGLPKAISGHLNYWYWGPRDHTGEFVIVLGDDRETLEGLFARVEEAGAVGHVYAMRSQHFRIYVCREPKNWTFRELWPRLKNWN